MAKADEIDVGKFTDWRGNEVKVGDLIAYPVTVGRSASIATGIVLRIWKKKHPYQDGAFNHRISVQPTDRASNHWRYSYKPDVPEKVSTLQFWDRAILLESAPAAGDDYSVD